MPITDLTGTTWLIDEQPEMLGYDEDGIGLTYYINFLSNNTIYSNISNTEEIERWQQLYYNGPGNVVYSQRTGWANENYRTIEITGGTDATNSDLIAWLEANGTLTAPQPQPTGTNNIWLGTTKLAKAFVGNSEIASMWLGNTKIYEKGSPTPSGYSGDINSYETVPIYGVNKTKIKFDTPPTSDNDYDSYVDFLGGLTGLTSYQNKTKIYIWCDAGYDTFYSIVRINGITYNGGSNYSQATEVLLTGNYDIELGYSRNGGSAF